VYVAILPFVIVSLLSVRHGGNEMYLQGYCNSFCFNCAVAVGWHPLSDEQYI
jgi:hypothetical protein